MAAPIRPYGCVFAFSGDAQKSLQGNYQFFEMDHNRLGGVMNQFNQQGIRQTHLLCFMWKNDSRPKANSPQKVKN
jgi:hypothetical protein